MEQESPVMVFQCSVCGRTHSVEFSATNIITHRFQGEGSKSLWNVDWADPVCYYCDSRLKVESFLVSRPESRVDQESVPAPVDQFLGRLEQLLKETFKKDWDYNILMEKGTIHLDVVVPFLAEEKEIIEEGNLAR